ncbi:MAG: ZIP family metal transporter [Candidatus Woesearchaeota archaeon]
MGILFWILLATLVNGAVGLIGIFSLFMSQRFLKKILMVLVAFSAGALLSGALFHLLGEALSVLDVTTVFVIFLIGFVLFFLVERFLHWHHCHDGKCEVHPFNYLVLFGDGVHNFIDGVVIAASFFVGIPFGFVTTLLIIAHEVPQELGNFGILIYGGFGKLKAVFYSFIAQLTCVLGGLIGYILSGSAKGLSAYVLPFAAGGFVYIAASDLVPELHKEPKMKKSMISFSFFVLGIVFIWLVKVFLEP